MAVGVVIRLRDKHPGHQFLTSLTHSPTTSLHPSIHPSPWGHEFVSQLLSLTQILYPGFILSTHPRFLFYLQLVDGNICIVVCVLRFRLFWVHRDCLFLFLKSLFLVSYVFLISEPSIMRRTSSIHNLSSFFSRVYFPSPPLSRSPSFFFLSLSSFPSKVPWGVWRRSPRQHNIYHSC